MRGNDEPAHHVWVGPSVRNLCGADPGVDHGVEPEVGEQTVLDVDRVTGVEPWGPKRSQMSIASAEVHTQAPIQAPIQAQQISLLYIYVQRSLLFFS